MIYVLWLTFGVLATLSLWAAGVGEGVVPLWVAAGLGLFLGLFLGAVWRVRWRGRPAGTADERGPRAGA